MNYGRLEFGCITIPGNKDQIDRIIVVGGQNIAYVKHVVESLEIGPEKKWQVIGESPLTCLSRNSVTISRSPEYILYSIGGMWSKDVIRTQEIFGLKDNFDWSRVGNLLEHRSLHTTVNVETKEMLGCS